MQANGKWAVTGLLLFLASWIGSAGCGSSHEAPPDASIESRAPSQSPQNQDAALFALSEPVEVRAEAASTETPATMPQIEERPPEVLVKTSMGDIRIQLNPRKAPITVDNFLENYVDRGFYDNTVFHYVDKGFMIAAGGYTPDLEPKETRAYIRNEADNGLKNLRGTVAMARHPDHIDSATSQFYINLVDNPALDFKDSDTPENYGYCVFGKVIEGMDVVDRIAEVKVTDKGSFPKTPTEPVVIHSIQRIQ